MKLNVSWLSAGVSSFIATYLVRKTVDEIYYIDIADQHPDSLRFVDACAHVLGKPIIILRSPLKSVENACLQGSCIKIAPTGWAPCTAYLKQRVRKEQIEMLHKNDDITYIWGFDTVEVKRAERLNESMPQYKHIHPLIDNQLTKQDSHALCAKLGVKRPKMYDLGYQNNNCVGCVKGGMGYWNKIRVDFPEVFKKRADLERKLNSRCLKECYLDELDPNRGNFDSEILQDCGIFCEIALKEKL